MSEAVKLSLTQYFEQRRDFRPRDLLSSCPEPLQMAEDPYARGLADGQQIAEAAFSIERKRLQALLASADALRPEDNAEIGFLLDNIVRTVVAKIIGDLPIDAPFLQQQITAATLVLTEADENRTLRLHPEDLALLAGVDLPLASGPDPQLARGAVRIECSDGWIEHGPSFALDRLNQALLVDGGMS
jgi:flagellar assembly protein FliH